MPNKCFTSPALRLIAVTAVALVFVERPLKAYADPGSGLLMWQLLGAFIIGAGYQVRRLVIKLRTLGAREAVPKHQSAASASQSRTRENGHGVFLS
jgi:hypothetical protein